MIERYRTRTEEAVTLWREAQQSVYTFLDYMIQAREEMGETYSQFQSDVAEEAGIEESTLRKYIGCYEASRNQSWHHPALSISHHLAVDSPMLAPEDKKALLTVAQEGHWTVRKLKSEKMGLTGQVESDSKCAKYKQAFQEVREAYGKHVVGEYDYEYEAVLLFLDEWMKKWQELA